MNTFDEKFSKWKESVEARKNITSTRRELFEKLKKAHDWCATHPDHSRFNEVIEKVENLYDEMEAVGIDKKYSAAFFLFGGIPDEDAIYQHSYETSKDPEVLPEVPQPNEPEPLDLWDDLPL